MTADEIRAWLAQPRYWYHIIDLGNGIKTPGHEPLIPIWELIREARQMLSYQDCRVLDLASYDGLWAFEAEQLGAKRVVATDCCDVASLENLLFCRGVLESDVLPYFNISPYNVFERLDTYFDDVGALFDIVHHTGLLYHLRDPLYTLSQARSCLKLDGTLLLETAIYKPVSGGDESVMQFNGPSMRIYVDSTTWWAPSMQALREMLEMSLFEIIPGTIKMIQQNETIWRVALLARATSTPSKCFTELMRGSRNPGLTPLKRFSKEMLSIFERP